MADPTVLPDDPRFTGAVELLRRTGADKFRVGYSDEDDGPPTVWYAVATWTARAGGYKVRGQERHEAAAALDPVQATFRLCDQVITGGECTHCRKQTIFDVNPGDSPFDALLDALGCVYAWDPELAVFRRGCEGD